MANFNEYEAYEKKKFLLNARYRYVSHIQEGSFGKVTLAIDVTTGEEVAMKAMYKTDEHNKRMAQREVKILTMLGHSNEHICQLVDHFETSDFIIMILEYCSNGDLYDLTHSSKCALPINVWTIAKEISDAMKYAHSLGVYHRDIKPENILFNKNGKAKLCDWGLSTTVRKNSEFNVGTEKYMAPECFIQREGLKYYDCVYSDYWSFGVTMLTAVFMTSPFKTIGNPPSIKADFNFKNFVNFGNSLILYDIYPTMSVNCYRTFMNLLKVGSDDDSLSDFVSRNRTRDLDAFMNDLQLSIKYGLTIDDELEVEDMYSVTEDRPSEVFEMEKEYLTSSHTNVESLRSSDIYELDADGEKELALGDVKSIEIPGKPKNEEFDSGLPSLIESSLASSTSKSWCDLDDDITDQRVSELLSQLSLQNSVGRCKAEKMNVSFSSKDVSVERDCCVFTNEWQLLSSANSEVKW